MCDKRFSVRVYCFTTNTNIYIFFSLFLISGHGGSVLEQRFPVDCNRPSENLGSEETVKISSYLEKNACSALLIPVFTSNKYISIL